MATQSLLRHGRCAEEEAGLEVNLSTLNSAAAAASPSPQCWGVPATSASPSCPPLLFFLTTLTSLSPALSRATVCQVPESLLTIHV